MAYVVLEEQYLNDIANHIRYKNGATTKYKPREMADAIRGLSALSDRTDVEDAYLTGSITNFTYTHIPTIGYAFAYDQNLKSVNTPGVITVGGYAFEGCENLTTINLPELTNAYPYAFANCPGLREVNLPKLNTQYVSLFSGCENLSSVNLPSLESANPHTFYYCKSLTKIILPSLKTYSDSCFNCCDNLTTIILPNSIKAEFRHYETSFINPNPITDGTCYIYVPQNLLSSYKNGTSGWTKYYSSSVFRAIEDYPEIGAML